MFQKHIEIVDPAFAKLVLMNSHLETLWSGARWLEGPVWFGDMRSLFMSDIPNDRMLRYDEASGLVSVFRSPSGYSNGNTRDPQGRLITCEHGPRRVTRTEHDGRLTVLAERWNGKRLNSPNDVVVANDGSVWFTDPSYGIDGDYEGHPAVSEIGASCLYRVDGVTGKVEQIVSEFVQPNGLAFSADGSLLYVADSGATHVENGPRHIRKFNVDGTKVSGGDVMATCPVGLYDGFRIDVLGNLWVSTGEGVHVLAPDGRLLGKILVPEVVANVCFGGPKRNRLFICGTRSLYSTFVGVSGLSYGRD